MSITTRKKWVCSNDPPSVSFWWSFARNILFCKKKPLENYIIIHHHVSRKMSSLLMRFSRDPILDFFLPLVNQISLCDARLPILYYIWPPTSKWIACYRLPTLDLQRPFRPPIIFNLQSHWAEFSMCQKQKRKGQITSEEVSSDYLFTFCFIRNKAWLDSWRVTGQYL